MQEIPRLEQSERFRQVIRRIDEVNREDPSGWEHAHGIAVAEWILRLRPDASEALCVAGRAQHIGRWQTPRSSFPAGRAGYLRWRRHLQALHAERAAGIVAACSYELAFVERVRALVAKQAPADDPEMQTLEDALCLVFIERQLDHFRLRHDEAKLGRIIRRTWARMSPAARAAALELTLPDPVRLLLRQSLDS